jgi:hypothetical protein
MNEIVKPQADPYQRLAVWVIRQAMFETQSLVAAGGKRKNVIDALEFLCEREDEVVFLWFKLAGLSVESVRRSRYGRAFAKQLHDMRHHDAPARRGRNYFSRSRRESEALRHAG